MCRHAHVTLSVEDRKDAKKLSGFMIPVYASVLLAMVAAVAVSATSPRGDQVASSSAPVSAR